jgi:siroheme synthase (precorrin-2 oxidase/ferrochelatase)
VSTGGGGPALAAHIARELAQRYGPEWGELAALLGELRADPAVASALAGCDETERARRWRSVLAADTLTYLRTGDRPRAREVALSCLSSPSG